VFTLSDGIDDQDEVDNGEEDYIEFFESGEDAKKLFSLQMSRTTSSCFLKSSQSHSQEPIRLDQDGTTGIMPRFSTNCRVSLLS
jgi:hypothetical protein